MIDDMSVQVPLKKGFRYAQYSDAAQECDATKVE